MKEILDYLSRLRENNNREWFQAHKEEYDRLRPLFVEKIQELIQQISQFDEDIVGLEAKNCIAFIVIFVSRRIKLRINRICPLI